MVFLCFSSKDRYDFVESVYYHLNNIGIATWYDRKKVLMGDNRDWLNFVDGVQSCESAIIVLSPNSIASVCANEEIDLIYQRFIAGEMYIFPVFYNISADNIPSKYEWMKKLVYKELSVSNDSLSLCNHVACKILLDEVTRQKFRTMEEIACISSDEYLRKLIESYNDIDGCNYNARIAILYAGIMYMFSKKESLPTQWAKGATFIFNETKLNLVIDQRETLIYERLFILTSNSYLL